MAEYSIDDILAELDAKKKGIKLPEKNSADEEATEVEEQAVAEEVAETPKAKPPVDLSVTAILDDIVTSAGLYGSVEQLVLADEEGKGKGEEKLEIPDTFSERNRDRELGVDIDAITGTMSDVDKVLIETDAFERPEDKTEAVIKKKEEKKKEPVKETEEEDAEAARQKELAEEEKRRLMLEKERENTDPDDMLDLVNPMEVREKASRQARVDEISLATQVVAEQEEKTRVLDGDVKEAIFTASPKPVEETKEEISETPETEEVKEYGGAGKSTDDLIQRLNKGIARKRQENLRTYRTITLTDIARRTKATLIAHPLNIDYKKQIIQETGQLKGENPVVEGEKQAELQAAKKHQLKDFVLEDDSVNEIPDETEEEEEEFDDYDSRGQIWADLCASHKGLKVRLILLAVITVITTFISLLNDFGLFETLGLSNALGFLNVRSGNISAITFIYLAAGILSFGICSGVLSNGLIKLVKLCPDCDTVCSVTAVLSVIGGVLCMIEGQSFRLGHCFIYVSTALVALTFNTIGKLYMITRAKRNFKFVSGDNQKYYAQIISNRASVSVLSRVSAERKPVIAAMRKTEFLTDFLRSSYCDDEADKLSPKLVYGSLIAGLVVALMAFFNPFGSEFINPVESESTLYWAISSFTAVVAAASPFSMLLMINAPLSRASRRLSESKAAILGYDSAMEFSQVNTVITDAKALFPAGSVQIAKIKLWHKKNAIVKTSVEESILMAASLSIHTDGILSYPFYDVMRGDKELLYTVENCIYEDNCGVTGWIGAKRVMLGGRQLMRTHDIDLPSTKNEGKYCPDGCEPVYLAVSGEIVAMFVISMKPNTQVKQHLQNLVKDRIKVLIRTTDSLVNRDNVAALFDVNPKYIKVLPHEAHEEFNECTKYTSRGSGALSCNGTFSSFTQGILAAKSLVRDFAASKIVLLSSAIFGGFFAAVMAIMKQTAFISPSAITLYGIFTTLLMIGIQKLIKYR